MKTHFERFLKSKRIEGCTEKTLQAYRFDIERFLAFASEYLDDPNPPVQALNRDLVEDWLALRPLENATRARMLASIRSFSRWLTDRQVLEKNPLDQLKTPRIKAKAISFLTVEEFQKLMQMAQAPAGPREIPGRDCAILALFIGSGIRISELAGIKEDDINFKDQQIKVKRKGGKSQYVPIGRAVVDQLLIWQENRRKMALPESVKHFFISNRKRPMSIQTIRNVVKKWMKRAGLWGKKMSPHTLRHSYATAQISAGTPVQVVQELMGHNQLNTTSKYLHIVDKERKKAAEKISF